VRRLTRRQRISAATLVVLALCFITLDLGGGSLSGAHSGVRGTLGALYRGTDGVLGPARRWVQGVPTAGSNQSHIDRLNRENAALRTRIAALQADKRTGAELAALQKSADGTGQTLLPARVIAYGPGQGFDWTVTIDAGRSDGVRVGKTERRQRARRPGAARGLEHLGRAAGRRPGLRRRGSGRAQR